MKKKNSVKKNFLYNIIYQVLLLIIPLICAPYLARTLGSNGVGTYSYVYSIVYYFMIFIVLGLENYGNRTIAQTRYNKEKLSKTFWEIYSFQLLMGIIIIIFYLLINFFVIDNEYKFIFLLQIFFVISSVLDINWFFFGIEKFKATITRNTIVKVISLVLIMLLIKDSDDLWKYTLIMSLSTLISQLILWPFLFKEISFCEVKIKDVIKHIKPNLKLFIPVIAVSIYKMIDKVMLGCLSEIEEVAFYENAEKLIKVPTGLIGALGVVMLPRVSNLLANEKENQVKEYINNSLKFICFISFPMMVGIICISNSFIHVFYGNEFYKSSDVLILLSLTIPMIAWGNVIRTQYLIPKEYDKEYIISAIYGAIINVILNLIFIPNYGATGACIGTIMAEFVVVLYQSVSVKKELCINTYVKNSIPFILSSIIMGGIVYLINFIRLSNISKIFLQILIGVSIYVILNLNYILKIIDIKFYIEKLFSKKKKEGC